MAREIKRPATAFALSGKIKRPRQNAATHLAWIRTLPCIVTGVVGVHAAHIRYGSMMHGKRETGMSEKPDDKWAVPLSPDEHTDGKNAQHKMSERKYWQSKGIDPIVIAALLWAASGDDEAGASICANARTICLWSGGAR